jgi:hypothetical protein
VSVTPERGRAPGLRAPTGVSGDHGDRHHEVVRLVVRQGQPVPVEAVEGDGRGEREPLVAVDQRLRPGRRVQQRGSLVVERGVGVLAERRGP